MIINIQQKLVSEVKKCVHQNHIYVLKGHFSQIECSKLCKSFSHIKHHCSDKFNAKSKTNIQISSVPMKFLCFKFKQNCITHICTKYHEDSTK